MEAMRHDIVNVHNEYRRQHGCPDLSVTTDLAREAQQWSDILATRGYAQYSDTQGEKIFSDNFRHWLVYTSDIKKYITSRKEVEIIQICIRYEVNNLVFQTVGIILLLVY